MTRSLFQIFPGGASRAAAAFKMSNRCHYELNGINECALECKHVGLSPDTLTANCVSPKKEKWCHTSNPCLRCWVPLCEQTSVSFPILNSELFSLQVLFFRKQPLWPWRLFFLLCESVCVVHLTPKERLPLTPHIFFFRFCECVMGYTQRFTTIEHQGSAALCMGSKSLVSFVSFLSLCCFGHVHTGL